MGCRILPIAMAKNSIGMAIACEEYGAKFSLTVRRPEASGASRCCKDPDKKYATAGMQPSAAAPIPTRWPFGKGMKYTPISISPEQAQFLETKKFQIDEIARIFRIPPHMIGDPKIELFQYRAAVTGVREIHA